MKRPEPIPMVRCHLDGLEAFELVNVRYIPQVEFELWKHLMETRHARQVTVDAASIWVPEEASRWNSGFAADELEPVLRIRLELPGPYGVPLRIERFFPAETYPRAQEALLSHYDAASRPHKVRATPGYFVPAPRSAPSSIE